MGETILANRFVNGLLLSLKVKVVRSEGTMDQLFIKARFEESKSGELRSGLRGPSQRRQDSSSNSCPAATAPQIGKYPRGNGESKANGEKGRKCFNCGMGNHLRCDCLFHKPTKQSEAHGPKCVAALTVCSKIS